MNFNVSRISLLPLITKSVTKQRMPTLYGRFKIQLLLSKLLLSTNFLYLTRSPPEMLPKNAFKASRAVF